MGWNLEGMQVKGLYLSGDVPVSGKVTLSRVCYGGSVSHHIELDEGFQWKNSAGKVVIKREAGESVIVDHKYITAVCD
tara:strand:+ start:216 stop:449 length:234 start_codon:yes stop_codon:yes gene_type:complete